MIRFLAVILVITFCSCKELPKETSCFCKSNSNNLVNEFELMTDNLRSFDVKVTSTPVIQSFQRKGKGKLLSISFSEVISAQNLTLRVEVLIDSCQKYVFPISYGNMSKKDYRSPSVNYKNGNNFQIPLTAPVLFCKTCAVSFIVDPIVEYPVSMGTSRGAFYNILVVWGK